MNALDDKEEEENKDDTEYNQRNSSQALFFKEFAQNFKVLFEYAGKHCVCN